MIKKDVKYTLNTRCCINCKYFKEEEYRDICTLFSDEDNQTIPTARCTKFEKV